MISSLGIGSGLDLKTLVDSLVAAERDPVVARLDQREATLSAELSGYGLLRSALADFQGSLSALRSSTSFERRSASSSDTTILTASAQDGAPVQTAQVEVSRLATSHALASAAYGSEDAVIGTGTLTIRFGTTVYDPVTDTYTSFTLNPEQASVSITVDSGNNTLSGLRDYINQNDLGLQATVVNDGSGYRLALSPTSTGAANSLEITVSDTGDGNDTDTNGLSALAFNSAATNLTQTRAAQDAELKVNGLTVTRSGNTVSDLLTGVTLELKDASPGTTVNVEVSRNSSAITADIGNFVDKYNGLLSTMDDLAGYNADTRQGGILQGDAGVRGISSQLRALITDVQDGVSGAYRSLVDIGITTGEDGRLAVDEATLSKALADDPEAVAALFAPTGRPSDSQIAFSGSTSDTRAGTYPVTVTALPARGVFNGAGVLPADLATTPVVIDADNDTLTLKVDGVATSTVTLTQGSYTDGDALAQMIQTQINQDDALTAAGVSVIVSHDAAAQRLVISSGRYGSASTVEVTGVDTTTAATLGLSVAAGTPGTDVAGTIGSNTATGSGRILTSDGGDSKGLAIEVLGGSPGGRGSVEFSTGLMSQLDGLISRFLDDEGLIKAREDGLASLLDDIDTSREQLDTRIERLQERLVRQFTALDSLVAQLQQTSTFLSQQLASLPQPTSGGNGN